jgi:F-type H+-transporting ATPase subunit b
MINLFDTAWLVSQETPHGATPADAAHAAAETHASGGLPQLDMSTWPGQLFWLAVTFSVLFLMLWRVILPRIGMAIEDRRDRIADDLDMASSLKDKAEASAAEYERLLAEARSKAHAMAMKNRDRVDQDVANEAAQADEEIAKRQVVAEQRISEMREKALSEVRNVAIETTEAIITELTGTKADTKALAAAVDADR